MLWIPASAGMTDWGASYRLIIIMDGAFFLFPAGIIFPVTADAGQ